MLLKLFCVTISIRKQVNLQNVFIINDDQKSVICAGIYAQFSQAQSQIYMYAQLMITIRWPM